MSKLFTKKTLLSFVFTSRPDSLSNSAAHTNKKQNKNMVYPMNAGKPTDNTNEGLPIISVRMWLTSCTIMFSPPPPTPQSLPLCRVITLQISCA